MATKSKYSTSVTIEAFPPPPSPPFFFERGGVLDCFQNIESGKNM